MKLKSMMILLASVLIVAMPRLAHPAGPEMSVNQSADLPDFNLPRGYLAEKIFSPPLQFPEFVAVSPSGVIVVTEQVGDRIIQVHEDGTLTTYASPSSDLHQSIAFDSASNLYVVDRRSVLWRVAPEGHVSQMATGVSTAGLDVSPSGDLFAINWGPNNIVQRITPDGQVSFFAAGFAQACDVAVSPITGEVYVTDCGEGKVYRANPDHTLTLMTEGLPATVAYLAFAGDGTLYLMENNTGLSTISTVDGTRTEIDWVRQNRQNLDPKDIDVDSQGRVVSADVTQNHVVRFDLDTETIEVLYMGIGNSSALAVAPNDGGIYLGVGHPLKEGYGRIVRIEADGSATPFIDGLAPGVEAMTFDADGVGYISAVRKGNPGTPVVNTIYSTTPSGITSTLTTLPHYVFSLAVDPTTGYLWGTGWDNNDNALWYLDDSGIHYLPFTIAELGQQYLAFTPDGTLYVYANTSDSTVAPVERGVYRVDPTGPTYTLVADLSTVNMCCAHGRIGAGRDSNIYWVGLGDQHTPSNVEDFYMLQITPGGGVTLFGQHLPVDPFAITGSPDSTDLFFTSGLGVYRVFEAEIVFLPLVLRNGD